MGVYTNLKTDGTTENNLLSNNEISSNDYGIYVYVYPSDSDIRKPTLTLKNNNMHSNGVDIEIPPFDRDRVSIEIS